MTSWCSCAVTVGALCRLQNKLRMFKLLSLQDEYAYLLSADYLDIIDRLLAAEQACCLPSHSGPCMDSPRHIWRVYQHHKPLACAGEGDQCRHSAGPHMVCRARAASVHRHQHQPCLPHGTLSH